MLGRQSIIEQLKKDEGYRQHTYECTEGKETIGYGRNLDDLGINETEAEYLLKQDVDRCVVELYENFKWFGNLPDKHQNVLVNMCFNLGIRRLKGFKKALAAFENEDYLEAAKEMKDSRWYVQVGNRAKRLVRIVSEGAIS